jgi:hypothetical protein
MLSFKLVYFKATFFSNASVIQYFIRRICTLLDPTTSSMVRSRSDLDMPSEDRVHQPHQRALYRE